MMTNRNRENVQKDKEKWYLMFWGFFISTPEYKKILLVAKAEEEALEESIALLNKHLRIFKKHGVMYRGNVVNYPHSVQLVHVSEGGIEAVSKYCFNETISAYGQVENNSVTA